MVVVWTCGDIGFIPMLYQSQYKFYTYLIRPKIWQRALILGPALYDNKRKSILEPVDMFKNLTFQEN
jgi:hypothetical protein